MADAAQDDQDRQDLPDHVDRRLHRQPLRQEPAARRRRDPDHRRRHRSLHRAAAQGRRQRLCPADHAARNAARRAARLVARQHLLLRARAGRLHHGVRCAASRQRRKARRHGGRDRLRVGRQAARLHGGRRFRDLGRLPWTGRHLRARAGRPRAAQAAHPHPGAGPEIRLRAVVRADPAVDALGRLPAAPVPDDGGRERRRAASAPGGVGVSALPAADQPVRPADRLGRPAPLRARPDGRRQLRPLAAAGPGAAGAGPVRLRRRAVGGHRHGDRRGDRGLDHGLQRPGHADAAAHPPLRRARPRRPGPAAAGYPAGRDRRRSAARLRLLRDRRRGLCAGQHRPHQLRRGGPVRAGDAGRAVLEGRHAQRCAGRPAARLRCSGPTR